jgi:hypothetical protein
MVLSWPFWKGCRALCLAPPQERQSFIIHIFINAMAIFFLITKKYYHPAVNLSREMANKIKQMAIFVCLLCFAWLQTRDCSIIEACVPGVAVFKGGKSSFVKTWRMPLYAFTDSLKRDYNILVR